MGCCHSSDTKAKVKHISKQASELKQLKKEDDVNVLSTMITHTKKIRNSKLEGSFPRSEYKPTRFVRIHLKCASNLPNLDFNITTVATNLVGVHSLDDLSDPYVLIAVGEAGVDWKLRQHQGPIIKSKTIFNDCRLVSSKQ